MNRNTFILLACLLVVGCGTGPSSQSAPADPALVGAWRSKIAFRTGPLAEAKGLEFLYAYNSGGTMTESSNYDEAANSSPPAYGVWKQVDARTFQATYVFFTTRAPVPADNAPGNADWWPAGHGVLTEAITLADDGRSYTSTIKLDLFDMADKPMAGGGEGTGAGTRVEF